MQRGRGAFFTEEDSANYRSVVHRLVYNWPIICEKTSPGLLAPSMFPALCGKRLHFCPYTSPGGNVDDDCENNRTGSLWLLEKDIIPPPKSCSFYIVLTRTLSRTWLIILGKWETKTQKLITWCD